MGYKQKIKESVTTSETMFVRTRLKGRLRFWLRLSSFPAVVGGGELALMCLETSNVSSVKAVKPTSLRYSS